MTININTAKHMLNTLFHIMLEAVHSPRLVIADELFPNPASGFRTAEYTYLLEQFQSAEVHSTAESIRFADAAESFETALSAYALIHQKPALRVRRWVQGQYLSVSGLYTLFLNNASNFLPAFERSRCGFIFTLYPGGGFKLDSPDSDTKLRRVLESHSLRAVIVTQKVTQRYLIDRCFCPAERVHLIQGVVVDPADLIDSPTPRQTPASKDDRFDIAFVAHKYMARGEDKGYDTFMAAAEWVASRRPDARFHVVGNFDGTDVPLGPFADRITFHGPRPSPWLAEFFLGIDLIVSPNVPFRLAPGAFDGFPTGSCVQAALAGVPVVCTDVLQENTMFRNGEEIVIVPPDLDAVAESVLRLLDDPDRLARIGAAGQRAFREAYSVERQLVPRADLLRTTFGLE